VDRKLRRSRHLCIKDKSAGIKSNVK